MTRDEPSSITSITSFQFPGGLRVWAPRGSRLGTQFLYREHFQQYCYEKKGVVVKDSDTIFDVGGNIGMFALSLMRRFRSLRICCFEPVPTTHACLVRNLAESPFRAGHSVTTYNLALGAAPGETTIEYFPDAPLLSSQYSAEKHRLLPKLPDAIRWTDVWRMNKLGALLFLPFFPLRKRLLSPVVERVLAGGVPTSCQVRTVSSMIDEYCVESIDLLKVDVEGAEMDVLAGIEDRHWPIIRQLAMEVAVFNRQYVPALQDRLRSLGFARTGLESVLGGQLCTIYAART